MPAPKPAAPTSMFAQTTALPSFKRTASAAPPTAPKVDAFAAALKAVERPAAPNAAAAQGIAGVLSRSSGGSAVPKEKKAKKSVRWRAEEELVARRIIEWRGDPLDEHGNRTQFAVEGEEDENEDEDMGLENEEKEDQRKEMKGMMEEQEGASMHLHFDEEDVEDVAEAVEWYHPTGKLDTQLGVDG